MYTGVRILISDAENENLDDKEQMALESQANLLINYYSHYLLLG